MKALLMTLVLSMTGLSYANNNKMVEGPTQLDDLIRGEMAAVKTYDTVLKSVKDEKELMKLKAIRKNHADAVAKLRSFASKEVKEDSQTAGAWGAFATAYTGSAKLFGNEAAIKALNQGEEHGVNEYKEALDDSSINPDLKKMIRTQFLPKQEEHIKTLKTFI